MKNTIFWDLDGTIIDSEEEVKSCLIKSLKEVNIDISKIVEPLRIGPTIDKILRASFLEKDLSENDIVLVVQYFRQIYDNSLFENTRLFPEILNFLDKNKDKTNIIITNKPEYPSFRILEKLGIKKYFKDIFTPYQENSEKKLNKTELFDIALKTYNLNKNFVIGIGDMISDCEAAKSNGIFSVGVSWGTGTIEELKSINCDMIISNIYEIEKILK